MSSAAEKKNILGLWCKVIVGCLPAAVLGILLDDILDEYLYTPWIVAAALVIYGVAFILVERFKLFSNCSSSKKTDSEEEICGDKFRVDIAIYLAAESHKILARLFLFVEGHVVSVSHTGNG